VTPSADVNRFAARIFKTPETVVDPNQPGLPYRAAASVGTGLVNGVKAAANDPLPFAGSLIGSAVMPQASLGLRVLGSAVGGGLGRAGSDAMSPSQSVTPERMFSEAAFAGGGELFGDLLTWPVRTAIAPLAGKVNTESLPIANAMRREIERNFPHPVTNAVHAVAGTAAVQPDMISRSAYNNFLAGLADAHNMGRDILLHKTQAAIDGVVNARSAELLATAGAQMPPEDFGKLLAYTIKGFEEDLAHGKAGDPGYLDLAIAPAAQIYNGLRDVAGGTIAKTKVGDRMVEARQGGARVNYGPVANDPAVREVLAAYEAGGDQTKFAPVNTWVKQFKNTVQPRIPSGAGVTNVVPRKSYVDAQNELSKLKQAERLIRMSNDSRGDKEAGMRVINTFKRPLEAEIVAGLDEFSPGLSLWYKQANTLTWRGHDTYNRTMLSRLVSLADPVSPGTGETIANRLFSPGKGYSRTNVADLKKLKAAMTPPDPNRPGQLSAKPGDSWDRLREFYTRSIVSDAFDENGVLDGKRLKTRIAREKSSGKAQYLYEDTPQTLDVLDKLGNYAEFWSTRGKSSVHPALQLIRGNDGNINVIGGVPGALERMASSGKLGHLAGSVPIVGKYGSYVAARLMTNPTTAKLLSEGFRIPAGTRRAAVVVTKLQMEAARETQLAEATERARQATISTLGNAAQALTDYVPSSPF